MLYRVLLLIGLLIGLLLFCAGCYDGKVYFIERCSGIIKWSFQTQGPVKSSACVNPRNGCAYIGSHDHHVYTFNVQVQQLLFMSLKIRQIINK